MHNLAIVLREQGQWQEAEQMYREALEVQRRVLGLEHLDTLASMHSLGVVLRDQGKWQEAEEMLGEVLELMFTALGSEHPWIWESRSDTAQVLVMRDRHDWAYRFQHLDKDTHQSRFNVAVKHVRSAIAALEKAKVAEDHPHLLSYRSYLAELLVQANEGTLLLEVEHLLQQVIPGLSNRFGVDDARAQRAISTLVSLLEEQGREKDAEQWRQHLLEAQHDGDDVGALPTQDLERDISEELQEKSDKVASILRQLPRKIASSKSGSTPSGPNEVQARATDRVSSCDASQLSAGQSDSSCAGYSLESDASAALLQAAALPVVQRRMRREREGRGGT